MKTLLLALVLLLSGCHDDSNDDPGGGNPWAHHPDVDLPLPQFNVSAGFFADCDELSAWLQTKSQQYDYYTSWVGGSGGGPIEVPVMGGNATPLSVMRNPVNMISPGVPSPDIVATDNSRIFVARSQTVEILDSGDLHSLQTLTFTDISFPQIFAVSGQLVVLGSNAASSYPYGTPSTMTVKIYQQGAGSDYLLQAQQVLSGQLLGARLSSGALTVIAQDLSTWDGSETPANGLFHGVTCSAIRKPLIDEFDQGLTIISRIPVNGSGAPSTIAAWGKTDVIYLTSGGHLYLGKYGTIWFPWDSRLDANAFQRLFVSRYDLGSTINFTAAGTVLGLPEDAHSFQEGADQTTLSLITDTTNPDYSQAYQFWVMSPTGALLNGTAAGPAVANQSSQYSLQWFGSDVVVASDSLKVWDLSLPAAPTQINSIDLAVSSGALTSVSNSLVFSLAKPSGGAMQLALVSVAMPAAPAIVDSVTLGSSLSMSDWLYDSSAIDVEAGYFALPLNLLANTGATIYAPTAPLTQLGTVSHSEWVPDNCLTSLVNGRSPSFDVRRVFTVNGLLISVSAFGAKASDPASAFAVTHSNQFANGDTECTQQLSPPFAGPILGTDPFYY